MTASSSSSSSSTVANKAQRTTTAALSSTTSSKNWRGKYLRALNISTPEVDVVSRKKQPPASVNTSDLRSQQQQLAQQARRSRANLTNSDNNNSKSVSVSRSFSTSTDRDGDEFQAARVNRYQVPQTARYSHRRTLTTREQLTTGSNKTGNYGFALKPDLARGRRCHTDPFVVSGGDNRTANESDNRVMASAPIQIPTSAGAGDIFSIGGKLSDLMDDDGGGATMANNNYKSKRYGSKSPVKTSRNNNHNRSSNKLVSSNNNQDAPVGNLLSWEEPAVMMIGVTTANINNNNTKPGGSTLGSGLDMAFSSLRLNGDLLGGVNNNSINNGDGELFCDEFVETEDEDEDEEDDLDEDDDEDDEIFEMEDFDSDTSNNNGSSKSSMFNSSVIAAKSKARRRRTASASQATATSPGMRRSAALPRYHSVRQMRSHGTLTSPSADSTTAMELPESFVPPHQLIQRDCFSIGLRDEFKRRQPKI